MARKTILKPPSWLKLYTVQPRRTWSVLDPITGMQIALVTGKRRAAALLAHLTSYGPAPWQKLQEIAAAWKREHPI